jgi:transposase-like protein
MICLTCSSDMLMVEYGYADPCHYDGISEYRCTSCLLRIGRWSEKTLGEGEHEPPYGGKHEKGCNK